MTVRARLTDGEIEMSAGPRLAEGQGRQVFAASDGGEQSLFQLGAPFGGDDGSPTEMHQHHHGCRGARLRQLLERPRHFSQAATRAAVLDGDKQAQHSAAAERRDVFARKAAFAVHLFGIASDDFLRRQLFGPRLRFANEDAAMRFGRRERFGHRWAHHLEIIDHEVAVPPPIPRK